MPRVIDALVFGGFVLVTAFAPGPPRGLDALLLLAIATSGFSYASRGRLGRIAGILALLAGWFWQPLAALLGLWLLMLATRFRRKRSRGSTELRRRADLARLTLRTVLEEPGRIRAFGERFESPRGGDAIPLVMSTVAGEIAFYVEAGRWSTEARERFLVWLVRLRESNRGTLPVQVRAATPVPEEILRAARSQSKGQGGSV